MKSNRMLRMLAAIFMGFLLTHSSFRERRSRQQAIIRLKRKTWETDHGVQKENLRRRRKKDTYTIELVIEYLNLS